MTVTLLLAVPATLCFGAAILLRHRHRRLLVFSVVAALAFFGVILVAYLSAAHNSSGSSCSDCQQLLGRFWEPDLVGILAFIASVGVLVGAGVGAFVASFMPAHTPD